MCLPFPASTVVFMFKFYKDKNHVCFIKKFISFMFAVRVCAVIQFGINHLNNIRSICLLIFLKKVQISKNTKF